MVKPKEVRKATSIPCVSRLEPPGTIRASEPEASCGGWRLARVVTSLQGRSCKHAAQQSDCLDLVMVRLRCEECFNNEVKVEDSTSVDAGRAVFLLGCV
jgi:hypothetical protein